MTFNPNFHHRRSIRLRNYDYAQAGLYFVTICTHERKPLFGKVMEGKMVLNDFGNIAHQTWQQTAVIRPNVVLHDFVIMPNHLHGIIEIVNIDDGSQEREQRTSTIGDMIRGYKSAVSRQIKILTQQSVCVIWQRNYHEHIIRHHNAYINIAEYIQNNPLRWQDDCYWTN